MFGPHRLKPGTAALSIEAQRVENLGGAEHPGLVIGRNESGMPSSR